MPRVLGRKARRALGAVLITLALTSVAAGGATPSRADTIAAGVSSSPLGQAMPSGFLGVSFEYRALQLYTGRDPRAIDPVLVSLLKGLAGQALGVRIGGDSTDGTWWPIGGMLPPGGIYYRLTGGWLRSTQALAADLRTKLILGINLEAGRPVIAAAEGRALMQGIGRRYIQALEIGNEPDLYGVFAWYRDHRGHSYRSRGRHYSLADYTREFTHWSRVLPRIPLAGPATSGPAWMGKLGRFISSERSLKIVTYHRYPLRACTTGPGTPGFPSIPNLLADSSSAGLANGVRSYVGVAHAHHLPLRLTEINSASCQGTAGVSDTFASALWALDTMFNMASVGVDGVNFHMLPGSHYELFSPSQTASGAWQAAVHPSYYGLLMFSQAFPPGARLLATSAPSGPVKVWATQDPAGVQRVTLINKDPAIAHDVALSVAGSPASATVETLQAPSASSTSGVTLGGRSFGDETSTGTLPSPQVSSISPAAGRVFTVSLPAGSAALLTVAQAGGGTPLTSHASVRGGAARRP